MRLGIDATSVVDPGILATDQGKRWYDALKSGKKDVMFATAMEIVASLQQPDPPVESLGPGLAGPVGVVADGVGQPEPAPGRPYSAGACRGWRGGM